MDSSTAARIFHDWAYSQGLMDDSAADVISTPSDYALIGNITDKGTEALRQKRIRAIGFDPSEGCVVVFTQRVAPRTKKQRESLPDRVSDVELVYRQGSPQPIADGAPTAHAGPTYVIRNPGTAQRYTCGSSISVGNYRDGGTLGCLVQNAAQEMFGLSNNHVTGGCSHAGIGLPIVAPAIADVAPGLLPPFTIGFHHHSLPLVAGSPDNVNSKPNLDAAIFKLHDPAKLTSYQRDVYDTPSLVAPMTPGMTVEKVGRTTALTTGTVISQVYGANCIHYQSQLYNFSGRVYFDPIFTIAGSSGLFSDAGDSGSLITTKNASGVRLAVGIVVGSMNDGTAQGGKTTLALPIGPILAGLGVTLVSAHNL